MDDDAGSAALLAGVAAAVEPAAAGRPLLVAAATGRAAPVERKVSVTVCLAASASLTVTGAEYVLPGPGVAGSSSAETVGAVVSS